MPSWKGASLSLIGIPGVHNGQLMIVEDWLSARARVTPDVPALFHKGICWTYAVLNEQAEHMCTRLATIIEPDQHVAVLMPNGLEYVCIIHALARVGAVLVPLNTRLTSRELRWQIDKSDCHVVIYSTGTSAMVGELANERISYLSVERLQDTQLVAERAKETAFDLDNLQAIVFTSGTTGEPKGAMLTFANHFWSATSSAFRLGVKQNDRWLSCLPLYHVGGLAVVFRSCLYGTAVVLHDRFDVEAISHSLDNEAVTLISLVPTMVQRLLDYRQGQKWPAQIRHLLLGGAAASPELLQHCRTLNIPVSTTYGLTEAASQVATALPEQTLQKPGSCGKPLIFLSLKSVDGNGRETPINQPGEIVVSGPTIMAGYYNDPRATAAAIQNGELHTGDIGYLDEDGDLWLLQRRSDMIISGGENIYPAEVEGILRQHPDIAEVCITGIANPEWGQCVGAMIVLHKGRSLTDGAVLEYGRRHLAGYKLPRVIKIVEELPRTASGKIQRQIVATELQTVFRGLSSSEV